MIILDSDVLIGFFNGEESAEDSIKKAIATGQEVRVSALAGQEVLYGEKGSKQETVKSFLETIGVVGFDWEEMTHTVTLRQALKKKGTPIGKMDELIAGTCLANNATIITRNKKHFSKVKGLKVETW